MKTRLTFIHALSPLHAGTGQGVDIIDLPIAREKSTGIPFLPGSSLKGPLRDLCGDSRKTQVFGPEKERASDHAGAIVFSDQRLLLLPVRSLAGTFAWVTSPYLLQRFKRDSMSTPVNQWPNIPPLDDQDQCFVTGDESKITMEEKVYLEDLDLEAKTHPDAASWADKLAAKLFTQDETWQNSFKARFCIAHDDLLGFLLDTATEITARIRLQSDAKTVEQGGLWYEEALPTETILTGLALSAPNGKTGMNDDDIFAVISAIIEKERQPQPLQLGGKATVGRGLCNVLLV
jgi:CRISPR-associated protein Cmr4